MRLSLRTLFHTLLCLSLLHLPLLPATAAEAEPFAGQYELLKTPISTLNPDKIEVIEFFWYTCPHCYHFEKHVIPWKAKLPSDVAFVQMPAVFNTKNVPFAALFYTAQTLGVLDKVHTPVFEAIHKENRTMDEAAVLDIFATHADITEAQFKGTYESFAVTTQVNRAKTFTGKAKITGVPAIIVNGRYRLVSRKIDGYVNMLKLVDYLIEKERERLQSMPKQATLAVE